MRRPFLRSVVFLTLLFGAALFASAREPLSFEERVKAQEAIERVYYNHRIWPKENPTPKPPFEEMMPGEVIEAKVNDYLKKCAALEKYWQRPIQPEQLQSEIDRMGKRTRNPAMLRELFTALHDDPDLIAACLAKPILADRLLQSWYPDDIRFHGESKAGAEEALRQAAQGASLESLNGGDYRRVRLILRDEDYSKSHKLAASDEIVIHSKREWTRLASQLGDAGRVANIMETGEAFLLRRVLQKEEGSLLVEQRTFRKTSLSDWLDLQTLDKSERDRLCGGAHDLSLPAVSDRNDLACAEGWAESSLSGIPDGREGHTAIWTGTEMIVWGGWDDGVYFNTGGRYNPSTDSWTATSTGDFCPSARQHHTAIWTGTEMVVWGGGTNGNDGKSGGRYNPTTNTWLPTSEGLHCPIGREYHTAIWTGTEMIVWGGTDSSYYPSYYVDGARYNPSTDGWLPISTDANCPSARTSHTAVWTGREMIIWGGLFRDTTDHYMNTGGKYDPLTDTWLPTSTDANCPSGREGHTAIWTGREMIAWGGADGSDYLITGSRYEPVTDTWYPISTIHPSPARRANHTAVWTGTEMIVWGGDSSDSSPNTGDRYNPATDRWSATSTGAGCPSARYHHTAVWTGTEMIVWGGMDTSYSYDLATGGRYNPSTDTWVPTLASECPSPREDHTAVWTGTEMIVWGGDAAFSYDYLNNGGRYYPATDSWKAIAPGLSGPQGRTMHTAVWTGTEMIVWGGYTWPGSPNTGDRYNPVTGAWSATSTGGNCPSARSQHTAVWTGTEMIVWGGLAAYSNLYTNTGGRYNPSTDGWTATSNAANCPSGRASHAAVWSGSEMIIWGGYFYDAGTHLVNTGGRYNPATDAWGPTSTGSPSPSGRNGHTAVWTGTEMIVWGGNGGGDDGWRYAATMDKWTPIYVSSPSPIRYDHSAVWTGSEMIVWGGWNGSTYLNTGGRFDPATGEWTVTPVGSHCPSGRAWHSAIWTGDEMVVWGGGADSCSVFSSGGRYRTGIVFPPIEGISESCGGGTALLSTAYYATYQWIKDGVDIPGATSRTFPAAATGAYGVRVLDTGACPGTWTSMPHTLTVHPIPAPIVSGASSGCSVSGVVLSTGTFATYQWIQDGADIPGATAQTYTAMAPGSYAVGVDDGYGCIGTSAAHPVAIYVSPTPVVTAYSIPPTGSCLTAGTILTTGSFATYQWIKDGVDIPGATAQNYSPTASGTYTVHVTNTNGCAGISAGVPVTVACTILPRPVIYIALDCSGSMAWEPTNSTNAGGVTPASGTPTSPAGTQVYAAPSSTAVNLAPSPVDYTGQPVAIWVCWGVGAASGGKYKEWDYQLVVFQGPASRMATVKNGLGNSVLVWSSTDNYTPPALSAFPSTSSFASAWKVANTSIVLPASVDANATGWYALGDGQRTWSLVYRWQTTNNTYLSNPGIPFTAYNSTTKAPTYGTIPAADIAPQNAIGQNKALVDWGLIVMYNASSCSSSSITTKVIADLTDSGNDTSLQTLLVPVASGGLSAAGSTPTRQLLSSTQTRIKSDFAADNQYACGRTYGTILMTDGQSNLCNPSDKNWIKVTTCTSGSCTAPATCPGASNCGCCPGQWCCDLGSSGFECTSGAPQNNWSAFPPGIAQADWNTTATHGSNYRLPVRTWVVGLSTAVSICELNWDAYMGRTDASDPGGLAGFGTAWPTSSNPVPTDPYLPQSTSDVSRYDGGAHGNYAYFLTDSTQIAANISVIVAAITPGTPAAATGPSPSDGATLCTPPQLSWSAASGALSYDIFLDGNLVCTETAVPTCSIGPLSAGPHAWTVVSRRGCASVAGPTWTFTTLPGPAPAISGPSAGCVRAGVLLSTGSFDTYQWIKDGVDLPGATGQTFTATASGSYTVRVRSGNGCEVTSAPFVVSAEADPQPTVTGPSPACGTASLSTQTFASYQWTKDGSAIPGATGQYYDATSPGSYAVHVTSVLGCEGASFPFMVRPTPAPVISGPSAGCASVVLETGPFTAYQWLLNGAPIPGATQSTYVAEESGAYTLTVTDAAGCIATSMEKTVTLATPPGVLGASANACPETSVALTATPAVSYQWTREGAAIPGANGPVYEATASGSYAVTTVDSGGCSLTSPEHPVSVTFCANSEVSPMRAFFPARLVRAASSPTGFYLYFQKIASAGGYNVYEGTLGRYYDHGGSPRKMCDLSSEDLGTGEMRTPLSPSAGDHYYLVTAWADGDEGPSGFDSAGGEISPELSTCAP